MTISSLALAAVFVGSSASANLVITPTYAANINSDPNAVQIKATIQQAINNFQSIYTDPITVNITFQEAGGLGSSNTFFDFVPYATLRAAMVTDATTADDALALASLPGGANNPVDGTANVAVTTANERALGLSAAIASDGTIGLNTSICNLVHGTNTNPSFFDLYAVTSHEIDEVLGTGSGVGNQGIGVRTQDLFRYSAAGIRSFSTDTTKHAFFSVNGGVTNTVEFNNFGRTGGDWGDWKINSPAQVQDWAGSPGITVEYGNSEMTDLDVQGYNRAPVPEPATMAILGLGVVALLRRRKKS